MKKIFFLLLVVLFSGTITSQVLGVANSPKKTKVEYTLPYPGILPDHPLYVLKRARDWVLDKLVVEPLRRIELSILQADKRLQMGVSLVEKNKPVLAEEIISKGTKYFNNAVYAAVSYQQSGKQVPGYLIDRLTKSAAKQQELLEELIIKVSGQAQTGLVQSLELIRKLQAELAKLKQP